MPPANRKEHNVKEGPKGNPPNQTLYCSNLPDKMQKQDLRRALYLLFSTYGPVLDVVALKSMKMRGQAHIVFRDVQASTQAMRALDGFEFFGKGMKVSYASGKSNTVAKLDGTFKMPVSALPAVTTQLQLSIFNAPPSSSTAPNNDTAGNAVSGDSSTAQPNGDLAASTLKRQREDESGDEDVPMEEDEDAMEESDGE